MTSSWSFILQLSSTIVLGISFLLVAGWSCASACNMDTTPTQPHRNSNTHRTKNNTTNVVVQQNSRKLLMMDILMSETYLAYKKWNKIPSDIKLVFYSSTISHYSATLHHYLSEPDDRLSSRKVRHIFGIKLLYTFLLSHLILLVSITQPKICKM